ncbi:PAS domain-containing protein, partial [Escherichia coli]|uniref:PAS domain-containing protein n=1 Tax=Escherichia coli TaxID=562 RepID=UPI002158375D
LMLASVLDALPIGMFWKDRESRILGCNQKFADDSGAADPAQLIGKTNFDSYPREIAAAYRADDLEVMNSGLPKLGIEEPLLLSTGAVVWIETNKIPLRNSAGEIIGLLGTYRDVTERRKAADERLRMALELAKARQDARMSLYDPLTGLANRRYL